MNRILVENVVVIGALDMVKRGVGVGNDGSLWDHICLRLCTKEIKP